MAKKSQSKPMKEILSRLEEFELIRTIVFQEEVILNEPVSKWPLVDCLISFHSKGFPLAKAGRCLTNTHFLSFFLSFSVI